MAVIIPYYNGSAFIERSARSVLEQTVAAAEFVVVDDGSNEEEARKLDLIAVDMGFRVLRKANGGQGSARNHGVRHTTSPFICFLDQDDFYLKNHIETLIDAFPDRDPHFGWVYGELFEADRDGNILRTSIVSHHASHPKTNIIDMIGSDMHVLPSASMISRIAFDDVGGFDPQFTGYEDDDLFLRIFRKGYTNHFTPQPVTVWCIHTDSTSYGIKMARSRLKYFAKLIALFPDEPEKGRYLTRDVIIRRFHYPIMSEAINAVMSKPGKFTQNREEYINIAREYISIVRNNAHVSSDIRKSLAIRAAILRSRRLRPLYRLSPFVRGLRRLFFKLYRTVARP